MKQVRYYSRITFTAGVLLILAIACKKDQSNEFVLKRAFAPSTVTTVNGETSATISWPASLFTLPGEPLYTVEVSKDLTFSVIDFTGTTNNLSLVITDDKLLIKQNYYARVKAVSTSGSSESNWSISSVFRITGEQFLNPFADTDIIDLGVIARWRLSPTLTKITLTPAGSASFDVILTPTDLTAGNTTIMGLTQSTSYSAEIFEGTKSKGTASFKTKASITGANLIDLTGTTGSPGILLTTMASAPGGSVIILRRGEPYDINSSYLFNKSLTVQSALGFGTNYAILRHTSNFNVAASSAIDSIVFKDLIVKGTRPLFASYNSDYILNINNACTVGKVRLDNCTIKILRGIVRVQASSTGAKITNYFVNNCVMDSIREFAIGSAFNASSIANIKITNSTAYRIRKFIDHRVAGNLSISLENCTFNEVVAGAVAATNAVIDFSPAAAGSTSILNCIFGKTWNETGAGTLMAGYRAPSGSPSVIGSYNTSDFVNTTNPISGLASYSGSAAALFTDPDNGNFKIKDPNFIGKNSVGDPRWRIN